jgi:hypothetical protein
MFSITPEEVIKTGGSLDAVRLPSEYGGGYMATAEITHQMHCLNFIRKGLYTNYDYYKNRSVEFTDPPHTVSVHLGELPSNFCV